VIEQQDLAGRDQAPERGACLGGSQPGALHQAVDVGRLAGAQALEDDLLGRALRQHLQLLEHRRLPASMTPRVRLDDAAAADGHARRGQPQHEQVAPRERHVVLQPDLDPGLFARLELVAIQQRQLAQRLGGARVEAHLGVVADRPRVPDQAQMGVDGAGRLETARARQHLSPPQVLDGQAAQVDRRPGTGRDGFQLLAVALQPAHAGPQPTRLDLQLLAQVQLAIDQRAGDDGAEAGDGEDAVDRQARPAGVGARALPGQQVLDDLDELVEPHPGRGRAGDDGHAAQGGGAQELLDVGLDQVEPLVVDQVALGQGHQAVGDAEQVEDGHVLARLGHDALVGGDHQQGDVDAADAGEHVVDEALVAGHVDDGDLDPVRQPQPGEAEVDGHAALLLLLEPVGVDAGEGADEGRLAVVDVAGRADDPHRWRTTAAASRASCSGRIARRSSSSRSSSMRPMTGGSARRSAAASPSGDSARSATAQLGWVCPGSEPPPMADRLSTAVPPTCSASARARRSSEPASAESMRHTGTSRSASPRR
jgi:hypothetical protein